MAIRRTFLNGLPTAGADGAAAAAAPPAANGKAKKSKKGDKTDAEGVEKKRRPGRVSPYTVFSMSLIQLYNTYSLHPTFLERQKALQEKAAAKNEQAEGSDRKVSKGGDGAMSIAASFWSELPQERKVGAQVRSHLHLPCRA